MKLSLIVAVLFTLSAPAVLQAQYFLAQDDGPALNLPEREQIPQPPQAEQLPLAPAEQGPVAPMEIPQSAPQPMPSYSQPMPPTPQYSAPHYSAPSTHYPATSAPLADSFYNHGIGFGIQCCEGGNPCADMVWSNYCADKKLWCHRARHCRHRHSGGCASGRCRGLCPPQPLGCTEPLHGCDCSAGSLPCCGHTLDRLHLSPNCGPHCGAGISGGARMFGGLWSALHAGRGCGAGCAAGCAADQGCCGEPAGEYSAPGHYSTPMPQPYETHPTSHPNSSYQEYMSHEPTPASPVGSSVNDDRTAENRFRLPRLTRLRAE